MPKTFKCPTCGEIVIDEPRWHGGGRARNRHTQVHHIVPRRFGGKDEEENLIKLCRRCHSAIHNFYADLAISMAVKKNPLFFEEALTCFIEWRRK